MEITIRPGAPEDMERCGDICYRAFRDIAQKHGFPPDFPSAEVATGLLKDLLGVPGMYCMVGAHDGRVVGSIFGDERSAIVGLGPMSIDPEAQNSSVGRRLLQYSLDRAEEKGFPGTRFLQAAYHNRSLALYTKLGCDVREILSTLQGPPIRTAVPGYDVRVATEADLDACNAVCARVHGHDRSGELADAIRQGSAMVVEHDGRITGYATGIAFFAHAVGESNEELKALIGAATEYGGPGFLLPTRNSEVFRWCLNHGLQVVQQMTLMTRGLYNEPRGAYLASILY